VITNMSKYLLALSEERSLVPSVVIMLEHGPETLGARHWYVLPCYARSIVGGLPHFVMPNCLHQWRDS
jgi:hypothetical protein